MKSKLWLRWAGVVVVVGIVLWTVLQWTSGVSDKGDSANPPAPANEGTPAQASQPKASSLGYPLTLAFRRAEGMADKQAYDVWRGTFSPLQGMVGKVLGEELFGSSPKRLEYFTRYSKEFPDKTILLHFNGTARDPRYEHADYFPGHWLHYEGTHLIEALDARSTTVHVDNPDLFLMNTGRYKNANDDLTICPLLPDGKPDWTQAEHLRLIGIDRDAGTLKVERGEYGTTARNFDAGAYIAPLVGHGPWGSTNNNIMMWAYNYSVGSPADANGQTAGDVLAKELGGMFRSDGALAAFDGVEFDVLFGDRFSVGNGGGRIVDVDGDGKGDNGIIGGVNVYRQGVVDFLQKLRSTLGNDKLILADGGTEYTQRAFGIVNGIETEGWPDLPDQKIKEWSTGLNNLLYWNKTSLKPNFSYINHKFTENGDIDASIPFSTTRLVLAAAVFTDSYFTYSISPPGKSFGIWDELWAGTKQQPGWLGRPTGPAEHLALKSPVLMDAFSDRDRETGTIEGDVKITKQTDGWRIEAAQPGADSIRFRWEGVNVSGEDLFLTLGIKGEPMAKYSDNMARMVRVGWERPSDLLNGRLLVGTVKRSGDKEETEYIGGSWKSDNGAVFSRENGLVVADTAHQAIRFSTPYQGGTGFTYWKKTATIDPSAEQLHFYSTVVPRACKGKPDGVTFRVNVIEPNHPDAVVYEEHQTEERWIEHKVDLQPWAGKRIELRFDGD
ncbi:MAG: hypothetical protein K0R75_2021, partial [Paenibacillaceae bacterium]|nr:hypothetical protein [Paenibacillaceae bacterium]